jgi:hypothetical protein
MATVIGLGIAKQVFQLHSVDVETGEIVRLKLKRSELLEHFAKLVPSMSLRWRRGVARSTGLAALQRWAMRCA